MENIQGTFHDTITGITVTRDLTPEEIAALPNSSHEKAPTAD